MSNDDIKSDPPARIASQPPHDAPSIGIQVLAWYQQLIDSATIFGSILASVMFSVMILDLAATPPSHGSETTVRTWSAVGAVLFVLLVLLCQSAGLMMKANAVYFANAFDRGELRFKVTVSIVSLLFQLWILVGTVFFSLVVKAYVPAVGWTAFGATVFLITGSVLTWIWQLVADMRVG